MKTEKEIKKIQSAFLKKMSEFNYEKYVAMKSNEFILNIGHGGISHVANGLKELTRGYAGQQYIGDFLVEIKKESLVTACCQADAVNMRAIPIFADFVYNLIPVDLRIKK